MKISRLPEWISDNIANIIGFCVVGGMVLGLIITLASVDAASQRFPVGTDVVVKNTNIKGTVTKTFGDMVVISYAEKDGTVKTVQYNYNLLQKQ